MTYQSLLLQQYLSTRKGKPFDNLYIDTMQTRNYALYHALGNILPGKIGIKV